MSEEDRQFNRIAVQGAVFGCIFGPFGACIWGVLSGGLGAMMLGSGLFALPLLAIFGAASGALIGAIIGTVVANIIVWQHHK